MISVDWIIFFEIDEEWDKIGFWGSLLIIYICISPAAQVRLRSGMSSRRQGERRRQAPLGLCRAAKEGDEVKLKQVFPWPLLSLALTFACGAS